MRYYLTKKDIENLEKVQQLKEQVKRLEEDLKPKIKSMCDKYGHNQTMTVAGRIIRTVRVESSSISWKSVAESYIPDEVLPSAVSDFTVPSIRRKVEIL